MTHSPLLLDMSAADLLAFEKNKHPESYFNALSHSFYRLMESENIAGLLALLHADSELVHHVPGRAGYSCIYWLCGSPIFAPVLSIFLKLGVSSEGLPIQQPAMPAPQRVNIDTPMEWAISSGNTVAIELLHAYGSQAHPLYLHKACLLGEGASVLKLLTLYGAKALRPFTPFACVESVRGSSEAPLSAFDALSLAANSKAIVPTTERRRMILEAHAYMEALFLEHCLLEAPATPPCYQNASLTHQTSPSHHAVTKDFTLIDTKKHEEGEQESGDQGSSSLAHRLAKRL